LFQLTEYTDDVFPLANLMYDGFVSLLKRRFLVFVNLPCVKIRDSNELSKILKFFAWDKVGHKFTESWGADITYLGVEDSVDVKTEAQRTKNSSRYKGK
jgi:hypothetical protein